MPNSKFQGLIPSLALFLLSVSIHASDPAKTQAWIGAKILNGKGDVIDPGVLVIKDGKIAAIGAPDKVTIPDGAEKMKKSM